MTAFRRIDTNMSKYPTQRRRVMEEPLSVELKHINKAIEEIKTRLDKAEIINTALKYAGMAVLGGAAAGYHGYFGSYRHLYGF
jgi:hypothetical protein